MDHPCQPLKDTTQEPRQNDQLEGSASGKSMPLEMHGAEGRANTAEEQPEQQSQQQEGREAVFDQGQPGQGGQGQPGQGGQGQPGQGGQGQPGQGGQGQPGQGGQGQPGDSGKHTPPQRTHAHPDKPLSVKEAQDTHQLQTQYKQERPTQSNKELPTQSQDQTLWNTHLQRQGQDMQSCEIQVLQTQKTQEKQMDTQASQETPAPQSGGLHTVPPTHQPPTAGPAHQPLTGPRQPQDQPPTPTQKPHKPPPSDKDLQQRRQEQHCKKLKKKLVGENQERINYLVQASRSVALAAVPGGRAMASQVGSLASAVGRRCVLRLAPALKRCLCKGCGTALVYGVNARVRHRSRRQKHVVVTCLTCHTIKRFVNDPKHRLWFEREEAMV